MTGPGADHPDIDPTIDGDIDPGIDPDILEELEFWTGPDEEESDREEPGGQAAPEEPVQAGAGSSGSLVLVGTPIGNLGDLSPRAVEALSAAAVIYCEDTRHSRKLLTHAGITGATLRSLHEHNEDDRIDEVVRCGPGRTDGGPGVATPACPASRTPGPGWWRPWPPPGWRSRWSPAPRPCSPRWWPAGWPPTASASRASCPGRGRSAARPWPRVAAETRTTVLFEAPGRVAATLADLADVCGADRPVAVARELTKLHEEFWRGSLAEAASWAGAHPVRGEVVLVVAGAPVVEDPGVGDDVLSAALAERLGAGERTRGVVDDVAATFGVPRRRVYELALATRPDGGPHGASGHPDGGGPPVSDQT